jgi:S-(hydroxymethyl)glutathione dehydrogenase / alcohol dehydrogenase
MPSSVAAAIVTGTGVPLEVREIVLPDPGPGQVKVRLAAAGVCHSDLSLSNGTLRQPFPAVLGHEGSGWVVSVGEGVSSVAPGDPVVFNWLPACRTCWFCQHGEPYLCEHAMDAQARPYAELTDGTPVYAGMSTAAFGEETVVSEAGLVRLPDDVPVHEAAIVGCAVLTGVGAVINAARVQAGDSVCVIGLGGVGLSAVQGARLAGADAIIAVDTSPAKEDIARKLGATHFILASKNTAREVRGLTSGRGVDHAFEVVGRSDTIRLAWNLARRGGQVVVVGIGAKDDMASFGALELFHFARTLKGCVFGSCDPERDAPKVLSRVRSGELNLADLISDEIKLSDIPAAFEKMLNGVGARSLVRFA